MIFSRESVSDVIDDVVSMARDHDAEVTEPVTGEFPLDVDQERYRRLESSGILRVFAARDEGRLAGYATIIVFKSLRRRNLTTAQEEAIYLAPEYRRGGAGLRFIRYIEGEMQKECEMIIWHSPLVNPTLGIVLSKMGYTKTHEVFIRRL